MGISVSRRRSHLCETEFLLCVVSAVSTCEVVSPKIYVFFVMSSWKKRNEMKDTLGINMANLQANQMLAVNLF